MPPQQTDGYTVEKAFQQLEKAVPTPNPSLVSWLGRGGCQRDQNQPKNLPAKGVQEQLETSQGKTEIHGRHKRGGVLKPIKGATMIGGKEYVSNKESPQHSLHKWGNL
jgi:hypothetical protein